VTDRLRWLGRHFLAAEAMLPRSPTVSSRSSGATVEISQRCRTVEVIGAANIFAPRSSRTAMKFPGLTKLGRSVPIRCAMKDACSLASFLDEHSCPMKSWARMSPTKSKKNRFMIAQPKWDRSVPLKIRPCGKRKRVKSPVRSQTWRCPHGSLPEHDFNVFETIERASAKAHPRRSEANPSSNTFLLFRGSNGKVGKPQPVPDARAPRDFYRLCGSLLRFRELRGLCE
jgi:hypothetical protein